METKNILVLAGIKFRADEIGQELAKGNKFIVKWKTIWKVCYSQAQRQYYAIKVHTSEWKKSITQPIQNTLKKKPCK